MKSEELKNRIRAIEKIIGIEKSNLKPKKSLVLSKEISLKIGDVIRKLTDLEKSIPDDNKKELEEIKKEIQNLKEIDNKEQLERIREDLINFFSKQIDYKKEFTEILEAIEGINIPNQDENTKRIIRVIEIELKKVKSKDYNIVLNQILDKIKELGKEGKEVKDVRVRNFSDNGIGRMIEVFVSAIKSVLDVFIKNKEEKEAIPVVLVDKDKKTFYNALFSCVSGGGGGPENVGIIEGGRIVDVSSMPLSGAPTNSLHTVAILYGFDGANFQPIRLDSILRGNMYVTVRQGTNVMPSMDAIARAGYVRTINKLVVDNYDYVSLSYTGDNLTGVVYRTGGDAGDIVCTLTLEYDDSDNLISITKT